MIRISMNGFTLARGPRLRVPARIPAALLLGFVLAGAAGCGGAADTGEAAGARADEGVVLGERDVARVTRGTLEEGITLTGTLEPYRRVDVKSQVAGTLARLGADRGDAVALGSVLAVIDAEGILSQAASAQAGVAAARAALALAVRQLESARTLYEAGALSEIEYEQAKAQHEAALAQLSAAQAAETMAAEQAAHSTVRSPIGGVVSDRVVETGEAIDRNQTLFTVVNTSRLELNGQVPVSEAVRLEVGQGVVFTLDALPGETYRGEVARIEPTADPGTRQVGVYLAMANPGGLVGGLFATGRVLSGAAREVLLVPVAALRGPAGEEHVFVVESGQIVRRPVAVTGRDERRGVVGVEGPLREGDIVLVSPGANVVEGMSVRLASRPAGDAALTDSSEVQ
jgi:RND family efflux transporter MFP subunit